MSTETILILGGSFAGIGAAHYALRHTIPQLPKKDGITYTVTLVNPSKEFYWRIAGPRAVVSKTMVPPRKYLYPIEPGFAYAKGSFHFVQGTATHVDTAGQTVSVSTPSGQQSIQYAALIIATGFTTPSPLFTQPIDGPDLESVYNDFQKDLQTAKHVVIGGGGPVGVETAGEIAEFLNGKPGFLSSSPKHYRTKVTLVCADKKMLPVLREAISKKAEKYLKRLGVDVLYNTKVVSATPNEDGKTPVQLGNGETIEADLYIDATGVRPNTSFLPKEWLDTRNRISSNPRTLRVDAAGPRVYALGDVGSYSRGGAMDLQDALPVVMTNLKTDLASHISGQAPGPDRLYTSNSKESQLVPVGTGKGVGAMMGWKLPSFFVWMIKGRDYMIGMLAVPTVNGDAWKKEKKWKPSVQVGEKGLSRG